MSFTNLAAVRDDEIPLSDRPKGWKNDHPLGVLGCLTSHVRAWQKYDLRHSQTLDANR